MFWHFVLFVLFVLLSRLAHVSQHHFPCLQAALFEAFTFSMHGLT